MFNMISFVKKRKEKKRKRHLKFRLKTTDQSIPEEYVEFQCWWKVPADFHDCKPAALLVGVVASSW